MQLNEQDIKRFYKIWFNLLDFTNEKFNVAPQVNNLAQSQSINPQDILPIREILWKDDSVLDEIVNKNPFDFDNSDLKLIQTWKHRVSDKFIIMKHLKNYTVFMGNKNLYGVIGIVTPLDEMYPSYRLPIMASSVIIPFEGKIIYDSFMIPYNVAFGKGSRSGFNEEYKEIKSKSGIISSF